MDKVTAYLSVVGLAYIIIGTFACLLLVLLSPSRIRIPTSIACMVVLVVLNKMPGLGMTAHVSKTLMFVAFAAIGMAATLDPGPRRPISWLSWIFLVNAFIAIFFVMSVSNRILALVIRLEWIFLVFSAILLARTVTDQRSLARIVSGFIVGHFIAIGVLLSGLLFDPAGSFKTGLGRYTPFESTPNVVGLIYIYGTVFSTHAIFFGRSTIMRPFFMALAAVSFGLGLLTASRQIVFGMVLSLSPILFTLIRRPFIAILCVIVISYSLGWVLDLGEERSSLRRLGSLESERPYIWREYLTIIAARPVFGLLGTRNENFELASEVGKHAHNSYIHALYHGGIVHAFPLFFLVIWTTVCGAYVWWHRKTLNYEPSIITMLYVLLLNIFLNGMVGTTLYHPTYAWAFINILLSTLFMSLFKEARQARKLAKARS